MPARKLSHQTTALEASSPRLAPRARQEQGQEAPGERGEVMASQDLGAKMDTLIRLMAVQLVGDRTGTEAFSCEMKLKIFLWDGMGPNLCEMGAPVPS